MRAEGGEGNGTGLAERERAATDMDRFLQRRSATVLKHPRKTCFERTATEADVAAVHGMYCELCRENGRPFTEQETETLLRFIQTALEKRTIVVRILEGEDGPAAMAAMFLRDPTWEKTRKTLWVSALYVKPAYRDGSRAMELIRECVRIARDFNATIEFAVYGGQRKAFERFGKQICTTYEAEVL